MVDNHRIGGNSAGKPMRVVVQSKGRKQNVRPFNLTLVDRLVLRLIADIDDQNLEIYSYLELCKLLHNVGYVYFHPHTHCKADAD